jgi:hypothetical protein
MYMVMKLSDRWIPFLVAQPETGMGYTIFTAILKDGRRFERVVIDSGHIVGVEGARSVPFDVSELAVLVVTHDKSNYPPR